MRCGRTSRRSSGSSARCRSGPAPAPAEAGAGRRSATIVDRLGRQLVGGGIEPGDVVAYSLPNGPETVALFLAITAARAIAAPLDPACRQDEFVSYLADLSPPAAVLLADEPAEAHAACATLGLRRIELRHDAPLKLELAPDAVSHCIMPLFHVHGLVAASLARCTRAERSSWRGGSSRAASGSTATAVWEAFESRRGGGRVRAAGRQARRGRRRRRRRLEPLLKPDTMAIAAQTGTLGTGAADAVVGIALGDRRRR